MKESPEDQWIGIGANTLGRTEAIKEFRVDLVEELMLRLNAMFEELAALAGKDRLRRGL